MPAFHTIVRLVAFAVGLLLLYLAWFTYETTDKRIQNKLEDLWLALAFEKRTPVGIAKRLFRTVVSLMDRMFDRLFGADHVSLRTICIATCFAYAGVVFSVGPLYLFAALADIDPEPIAKTFFLPIRGLTAVGLGALVIGALPAAHRSLRWLTYGAALVLLVSISVLAWVMAVRSEASPALIAAGASETTLAALIVTLVFGVLAVHAIRFGVHLLAKRDRTSRGLLLVSVLFIITLFAFVANVAVAMLAAREAGQLSIWLASLLQRGEVRFLLFSLGGPISLWGFVLLLAIALAVAVLLHLCLWPVIRFILMKTLYAAQRHELISGKTRLRATGAALVGIAIGDLYLWQLMKKIIGE
jgi:hypothetical protein